MNMKSLILRALAITTALALIGNWNPSAIWAADPVVDALIKFKQDIPLPAKEPGVLVRLDVEEGARVKKGQEIGLIDDSEPQMQKKAARYARDAAAKRAQDDVEIRFAKAQAAVAEKDYEKLMETNLRAIGAVPAVEVRRAKLDWDRALLAIEKSSKDQELAKYEWHTKQAELEAAELGINRRKIIAPFDGEVVEIQRKQDEWVNPGDAILRLVRRDVVRVEGKISQREFDPQELKDSDVTVEVQLARGRTEKVSGRIVDVSPVLSYDGRFVVRAEVANRQAGGNWILMDGQQARLTIHVKPPGAAAELSRKP
jgi:multidrug efflux pump subunit AcrA (membrane-fusion protein)